MDQNTRGTVRAEPSAKRVRAYLAGRLVADTRHPTMVWEVPYYPAYYLPLGDVTAELVPTGKTEHSPSRGDAELYDVRVDGAPRLGAPRRAGEERVAGGSRAGLHAPARPVSPGRHPGQLTACPGGGRRRDGGRLGPPGHLVRDGPAAALLPAAQRRPHRPAHPHVHPDPLPLQGDGHVLDGGRRARRSPRPAVGVPAAVAGEPEDRRARLLLRREGRRLPGRRAAGAPPHPLRLRPRPARLRRGRVRGEQQERVEEGAPVRFGEVPPCRLRQSRQRG